MEEIVGLGRLESGYAQESQSRIHFRGFQISNPRAPKQQAKPLASGQISSRPHTKFISNGGLVKEIPLFQGNLGWWNIIIWPEQLTISWHRSRIYRVSYNPNHMGVVWPKINPGPMCSLRFLHIQFFSAVFLSGTHIFMCDTHSYWPLEQLVGFCPRGLMGLNQRECYSFLLEGKRFVCCFFLEPNIKSSGEDKKTRQGRKHRMKFGADFPGNQKICSLMKSLKSTYFCDMSDILQYLYIAGVKIYPPWN